MSKFQKIISDDKPVLVDFFAEWCGPCKTMAPILKQVKDELGDNIKIIKVDVDKNNQIASNFGIRSVPTFKLFKSGKVVWSGSGLQQASQLKQIIQQQLK